MAPADFELLINLFGPKIMKRDARLRAAIPFQERLAVALRLLATLCSTFRFLNSQFVPEVCQTILEALMQNIQAKKKNCLLVQSKLFCT
jgi:hypothetical protein